MAQNVIEITVKSKDEGKADRESIKQGWKSVGDEADASGARMSGLGSKIAKVGAAAAVGIATAAVGIGKALYEVGATMDEMEDKIRVGTGASGEALEGLVTSAKRVGTQVPSDFGSVGDAVTALSQRLNLTGKPLEDMAAQMLNLSRITGTDVKTNIENLTRVFGDWGISADQQSATLDKMFRASQQTGVGVDQLSTSIVKFGAPLRQMGFSFEEAVAMVGKFEKEGVNTELVLGSMRIALGKLAKAQQDSGKSSIEAEKAQKSYNDAVAKHGATSVEARLAQEKLTAAQDKSKLATGDAGEVFRQYVEQIKAAGSASEANGLALELFGARAGPDMAAAIREGRLSINDLVNSISKGTDTINSASLETMDFSEQWQLTKNRLMVAFEPAAAKVFGALGDAMEKLGPKLAKMAEDLGPTLSIAIEAFIGVVGAALPIIQALATVLTGLGPAATPLVGIFIGGAAAVKGFGAAHSVLDLLPDKYNKMALAAVLNFAKMTAGAIAHGVASVAAATAAAAAWVVANIAMIAATGGILLAIGAVIAIVVLVVKNWDWCKEKAKAIWDAIWGVIKGAGEIIKKVVKGMIDFVVNLFMNWTIVGFVIKHWDAIKNGVKSAATAVINFVKNMISGIAGAFMDAVSRMASIGYDIVMGIWHGIQRGWNWLVDQVRNLARTLFIAAKSALGISSPSKLFMYVGEQVGQGLGVGITSTRSVVSRAARQLAESIDITGAANYSVRTGMGAPTSSAMGTGTSGPLVLQLRTSGAGGAIEEFLAEIIRNYVKVQGGDVQTVLGRAGR